MTLAQAQRISQARKRRKVFTEAGQSRREADESHRAAVKQERRERDRLTKAEKARPRREAKMSTLARLLDAVSYPAFCLRPSPITLASAPPLKQAQHTEIHGFFFKSALFCILRLV